MMKLFKHIVQNARHLDICLIILRVISSVEAPKITSPTWNAEEISTMRIWKDFYRVVA